MSAAMPEQLAAYKRAIDADIAAYAARLGAEVETGYGRMVREAETDIFLDILTRGGKRLRGALTMAGYEMCGGRDRAMIVQAARAVEMLHAYILIIDDIQDRSALRRGQPTAHRLLAAYHQRHKLQGDAAHSGLSLGLNAALAGAHAAAVVLAELPADPERRLKATAIANQTMLTTVHGQTLDIMNELRAPTEPDIEHVLEWKTARYTVISPLQIGMALAGARPRTLEKIVPFGLEAGKAFQIVDDMIGIFGDPADTGKTPGEDIREGKGTLLTLHALQKAAPADKLFLQKCLGNPRLTKTQFAQCQQVIKSSGALAAARARAEAHIAAALQALDKSRDDWDEQGTIFLRALTLALRDRAS